MKMNIEISREPRTQNLKVIKALNIGEPCIEIALVLLIIWTSMLKVSWWMISSFLILIIWTLFVSPYIHYHILNEGPLFLPPEHQNFKYWLFEARGLGNPFKFYERQKDGTFYFMKYGFQIGWFIVLLIFLTFGAIIHEEGAFALDLIGLFGYTSYSLELWVCFVLFGVGSILLLFIVLPVFMRLDNFLTTFNKYFLYLSGIALFLIIIMGLQFQILWDFWNNFLGEGHRWSLKPPTPLKRIQEETFADYFDTWIAYIFWGWLQQMLFLGCFATQLSRGFDTRNSKSGKTYACILSAIFFASMHVPAFWLSFATGIFGYFWAYRFMDMPNMAVFGINHGMLASLVERLLPINFTVGPSHLPSYISYLL